MAAQLTMTPAAERVLDVASRLFYDNGIHAVGVEWIAGEAGVTKKTLYDRFGSKDTLVGLYLQRRDERWRRHVIETVDGRRRVTPARKPLLVFDALESWMADDARGCAFVNAQAELPDAGHPGRVAIRVSKQWQVDYLRTLVREAGLRNPRKLATSLAVLLEGATVTASLAVAPGAIGNARDVARQLIDAA